MDINEINIFRSRNIIGLSSAETICHITEESNQKDINILKRKLSIEITYKHITINNANINQFEPSNFPNL